MPASINVVPFPLTINSYCSVDGRSLHFWIAAGE
jgi:hypothetical protein